MADKQKVKVWGSERWNIAKKMPPLHHSAPGEQFDISKSEVVKWLFEQPDIMQVVFNAVREKYIKYDRETGTWQGIDYEA